jgi:hypothetical protein
LIVAVVVLAKAHVGGAKAPPSAATARPLLLVSVLLGHALILPIVGFIPASAALFVIASRLMGSRRMALDIAIGLGGATALFFVFTRGLGLAL